MFTPGHTYGHSALHFADRGALIAGDAVVTLGHKWMHGPLATGALGPLDTRVANAGGPPAGTFATTTGTDLTGANLEIEMTPSDSAQIINDALQVLSGAPEEYAGLLPRFVDFHCTTEGTRWLRPLDLERGGLAGGPAWLRITSAGEVDEVRLPERFDAYRFTSDRIWGIQRDELNVASPAWVPVPDQG